MAGCHFRPLDTRDSTGLPFRAVVSSCTESSPSNKSAAGTSTTHRLRGSVIDSKRGNTCSQLHSRPVRLYSVSSTQGFRGVAPSVQSQAVKQVYTLPTFQDGGHPACQKSSSQGRLHGNGRPQGCLLHSTDFHKSSQVSSFHLEGDSVRIRSPPIWYCKCTKSVHKAVKTCSSLPTSSGYPLCDLHRRPPCFGRDIDHMRAQCQNCHRYFREPGVSYQLGEIEDCSTATSTVFGNDFRLSPDDDQSPRAEVVTAEGKLHGATQPICGINKKSGTMSGSNDCSTGCDNHCTTTLQSTAEGPDFRPHKDKVLRHKGEVITGSKVRTTMVGRLPGGLEREKYSPLPARAYYSDGCIQYGLGSSVQPTFVIIAEICNNADICNKNHVFHVIKPTFVIIAEICNNFYERQM